MIVLIELIIGGRKIRLKKISAVKVRQNLGSVMNEVYLRDDQYIIERDGKPLVAIVPMWKLQQWEKRKDIFFKGVEKIQQKFIGRDEEEVEIFLDEAVQEAKKNFNQEGTNSKHQPLISGLHLVGINTVAC
jgi:prevent-host-death family protein